jgi:hypothetical protein
MSLYTFIMDYKGGTYISQIEEVSLKTACNKWAKQLNTNEIYGLGEKSKALLKMLSLEEEIVAINGLNNVWCFTAFIRNSLVLVNIVKTAEIENRQSKI